MTKYLATILAAVTAAVVAVMPQLQVLLSHHPSALLIIVALSHLLSDTVTAPSGPPITQSGATKIIIGLVFLSCFAAAPLKAQTTPAGYPFAVSGMYSSSSGNATNNGMQNTIELSVTPRAPRGWAARLDMFGLNNPQGATLQIGSGQYKFQASKWFGNAPLWQSVDLAFHAGFGAMKSNAGAMAFAAGAGASADYNVNKNFFVRVLDFTYAYSRGLGNNGIALGNYTSAAAGIGFKF
jgi:hypothetical protein